MKRRDFSLQLAATGLGLALAGPARAQGAPTQGLQYTRLRAPMPPELPSPQKKVEVVEFFWYGCPHCFAFEPALEGWVRTLPADVYFHPFPFAFIGPVEHQKLFYALEDLGQRVALHDKIFDAIHVHNRHLNTESEITDFVAANGVDRAKFTAAFRSFDVATKVGRGKQVSSAWGIDGVPTLGIQGRYCTSPAQAGSHEQTLEVANYLIAKSRGSA